MIDHTIDYKIKGSPLLYLQIKGLEKTNGQNEIERLLEKAIKQFPDDDYIKWVVDHTDGKITDLETKELAEKEKSTSPVDNEFLLMIELLKLLE